MKHLKCVLSAATSRAPLSPRAQKLLGAKLQRRLHKSRAEGTVESADVLFVIWSSGIARDPIELIELSIGSQLVAATTPGPMANLAAARLALLLSMRLNLSPLPDDITADQVLWAIRKWRAMSEIGTDLIDAVEILN